MRILESTTTLSRLIVTFPVFRRDRVLLSWICLHLDPFSCCFHEIWAFRCPISHLSGNLFFLLNFFKLAITSYLFPGFQRCESDIFAHHSVHNPKGELLFCSWSDILCQRDASVSSLCTLHCLLMGNGSVQKEDMDLSQNANYFDHIDMI